MLEINTVNQNFPHSYVKKDDKVECFYGCGCWKMGSAYGGPEGLDPTGNCPNHPSVDTAAQTLE